MAEAMLMPTRTKPSAISARPSGRRDSLLLTFRKANQVRDRAEKLGALDGFGERARGARFDRLLRARALPGAEVAGYRDQLQPGVLAFHPADRLGAAGPRHPHVAHHERGASLQRGARRVAVSRLAYAVAGTLEPIDDQIAHDGVVVNDQDFFGVAQAAIPRDRDCG